MCAVHVLLGTRSLNLALLRVRELEHERRDVCGGIGDEHLSVAAGEGALDLVERLRLDELDGDAVLAQVDLARRPELLRSFSSKR